jgi:hypothetical protein
MTTRSPPLSVAVSDAVPVTPLSLDGSRVAVTVVSAPAGTLPASMTADSADVTNSNLN